MNFSRVTIPILFFWWLQQTTTTLTKRDLTPTRKMFLILHQENGVRLQIVFQSTKCGRVMDYSIPKETSFVSFVVIKTRVFMWREGYVQQKIIEIASACTLHFPEILRFVWHLHYNQLGSNVHTYFMTDAWDIIKKNSGESLGTGNK